MAISISNCLELLDELDSRITRSTSFKPVEIEEVLTLLKLLRTQRMHADCDERLNYTFAGNTDCWLAEDLYRSTKTVHLRLLAELDSLIEQLEDNEDPGVPQSSNWRNTAGNIFGDLMHYLKIENDVIRPMVTILQSDH